MKIVKTASGHKTLKISKVEWEHIGVTAGWKKASANYMIRTAKKNIALFQEKIQKFVKICQAQTKEDIIQEVGESNLTGAILDHLNIYKYDESFYFAGATANKYSLQDAKDSVTQSIMNVFKTKDSLKPLLESIVAYSRAGKPFSIGVSLGQDSTKKRPIMSLSFNGITVPSSGQIDFNAQLKNTCNILYAERIRSLTKQEKAEGLGQRDLQPEIKRTIRNSNDAAEAANAAGLIAGNVVVILCTQKREGDEFTPPSQSLDEKMWRWLSYSPRMQGERWTLGAYVKHRNIPIKAMQTALTYFTTITTEYKKVRAAVAQEVLLTRKDETSDLAFNLGLYEKFGELLNAMKTENTRSNRNFKWLTMDFDDYKDEILDNLLKKDELINAFMEDYKVDKKGAQEAIMGMFMEGLEGKVSLAYETEEEEREDEGVTDQ